MVSKASWTPVVGMKLERIRKIERSSNKCEIMHVFEDGTIRVQHLEGRKSLTTMSAVSWRNHWVPSLPPPVLEAHPLEERVATLERKLGRLLAALGEA